MGLTWPAFGKLQGVAGVGVNALRSAIWSELASDWVANNNPMPIRIVGRSPSPAATLPATDIWPANTVRAVPPSAGFTIAVASDSATDSNSLATGAMQLTVPYLDTTYTWHYCVFALNGTTKVNTVLSIDGVAQAAGVSVTNAMEVLPWSFVSASGVAGSLNTALQAGNIYIGNNTDAFTSGIPAAANMFDKLLIGDNRSNLGVFTVPAGMSLLVLHAYVFNSAAAAGPFYGKTWIAEAQWPGTLAAGVWTPGAGPIMPWQNMIFGAPSSTAGVPEWEPNWPDVLPPQSKIKLTGIATAGGEISTIIEAALAPWPWQGQP